MAGEDGCSRLLLAPRGARVDHHSLLCVKMPAIGGDVTCLGSNEHILATAGEDNVINLMRVTTPVSGQSSQQVLATLQGHLSAVKALVVSFSHATGSHLLFSGGGRAELKAWRLHRDVSGGGGATGVWHEWLADHRLTTATSSKPWRHKTLNVDPETRYLHLSCFPLSACHADDHVTSLRAGTGSASKHVTSLHCILCACSDGFIRIFFFDELKKSFHMVAQSDFHQHCVLRVKHYITRPSTSDQQRSQQVTLHSLGGAVRSPVLAFSAASDGNIALWDISQLLLAAATASTCSGDVKSHYCDDDVCAHPDGGVTRLDAPLLILQHHQAGVNSLDVTGRQGRRVAVASSVLVLYHMIVYV